MTDAKGLRLAAHTHADHPPAAPVGYTAYRNWETWPLQRIGVRAHLRSTYDRTGHNHTADASHYLYQESENCNVTLDVEGRGVLYFVRTNRWHGSPWHYEIDGVDHLVQESTTPDPLKPLPNPVFEPAALFPAPLAITYATTRGADLNWVPMPFDRRLRIAYSRTYYGTGYYIFHLFADPTGLTPWDGRTPPDPAVLDLLDRAGEHLAAQAEPDLRIQSGRATVRPEERITLLEIDDGPAMIRSLVLSAPAERARVFGSVHLVVTWDKRDLPSVDAPLALVFGAGTLHNPDGREWLVKALPVSIRFRAGRVELACHFPMPYFKSAKLELLAAPDRVVIEDVDWQVATRPYSGPWNHVGYFHATYRDHDRPRVGHDLEFLDTRGIEGSDLWSGTLVGTSFVFTRRNVLTTLEGDPRFYFDDSRTPQAQGTGTEEWGGGGDYWGGRTMSLPLAGHPTGIVDATRARHPDELIHSAYRFLLADAMPFGRRARICFEHGGENESVEHYESVTHWYGLPSPSLVPTDTLEVGDVASEVAHDYVSPEASAPYTLSSRYEWGPDHLPVAIAGPLAAPDDHVDFEFDAPAGGYDVWVEARIGTELFDAAVWLQFNSDIAGTTVQLDYMGSMGIPNAGRPPGDFGFVTGIRPASRVQLPNGRQKLRVQPRHGQMCFGRILLSPDRKSRPGPEFAPAAGEIVLGPGDVRACIGAYAIVDAPAAPGGRVIDLTRAPAEFEVFPAFEMTGRCTEGWSEFTLALEPDNHGVLLRRTLDYGFANQRANVYVEDAGRWVPAGVWYLAGSNTVYHSFPWLEGELAPVRARVITSNRRFRDDEFLLSSRLTRGRDRLHLRIEFAPRNPPLLPGLDPLPTAWTEFSYVAYCYVMPRVDVPAG